MEVFGYEFYEVVWLGGDVCVCMAKDFVMMDYFDFVFNLECIYWVLGNYDWDYGEWENVLSCLFFLFYYMVWEDGFCLMVFNINLFWLYFFILL